MVERAGAVHGRWRAWPAYRSLRLQLVTITALLAGVVAVCLVTIVQISLAGAATRATARVLVDRTNALVGSIDTASTSNTIVVPRMLLGPGVAVYDGTGTRVAGTVPPSMQEYFTTLSTTTKPELVDDGEDFAIKARPFTTAAGLRGVVVVTEPLAPYERAEQDALIVSIVAGGLLVLIVAGSVAWISTRILRPVQQMARTADDWSEHDLERRFALGPPTNELRALGHTLDSLLEKVASVIRAEQRLTSELAHELRTPLTTIHATAELMAMRTDLDDQTRADIAQIHSSSQVMSNTVTVLLDLARHSQERLHPERTHLADLSRELADLPRRAGRLEVHLPDDLVIDAPRSVVVRAIAPVVDNGLRLGEHVRVDGRIRDRRIEVTVADDGPGVPRGWRNSLFEPGWSTTAGSGLGLALARRVTRSVGGDLELTELHGRLGGATFTFTFPMAGSTRTDGTAIA